MKIYKAIIYIAIMLIVLIGVIYYFNKNKIPPIQVTNSDSSQPLEQKHANASLAGIYSVKGNRETSGGKIRFSYNASYSNIKIDLNNRKPNDSIPLSGDLDLILNNYAYIQDNEIGNIEKKERILKINGYLWPQEKIIDLSILDPEQAVTAVMPDGRKESFKLSDFYLPMIKYKEIYNIKETDAFLLENPPDDILPAGISELKTSGQLYFIVPKK